MTQRGVGKILDFVLDFDALPHVSNSGKTFLEEHQIRVIIQLSYSEDISLCDYFLFFLLSKNLLEYYLKINTNFM